MRICTEQHETNQQASWVMGLKAHWAEGHPLCHQFPAGSCPAPPVPTPPIQPKGHPRKGKNHIIRSTSVKTAFEEIHDIIKHFILIRESNQVDIYILLLLLFF